MRKIRVLHILNTDSFSGAENVAISIIRETSEEAEGIYLSKDGNIRKILDRKKIAFYPIEKLNVRVLKNAISELEPDIIHAHDFTAGIISVFSTNKIPIINHLHNNSPWIKRISWKTILFGMTCTQFKKILTVSNSIMDEYIFGKYFQRKVIVIGNPFSIQKIQKKSEYAEIKLKSDIIFLGRLSKPKNPFLFLDVINDLAKILPNIQAVMVGDGELRVQIESRIYELNLEKNVTLYGFQENPYGLLDAGKILCMPSLWEGFGLAALEALSLGKPVIATPVGGLVEIIDSTCGKLCITKEDFVKELYHLLTVEEEYNAKSSGAYIRAKKFDNVQKYMNILKELYCSLD